MKADFDSDFEFMKALCPECIYDKFHYPQTFKFDLVLSGENYGRLEITVKKGLFIDTLKGDEKALKKLDEIAKPLADKEMICVPWGVREEISYPLRDIQDIHEVICRTDENFNRNGDYNEMQELIAYYFHPYDEEILYKKTGLKFDY